MAKADFRGAIAFGGEVSETLHLLGYQNSAVSYVGPNCMLLHVPMKGLLSADNLVSVDHAPKFMKDMGRSILPLAPQLRGGGMTFRGATGSAAIVVKYGAYELVLASSASDIPGALNRVSTEKRPTVNHDLLAWYDQYFPGYGFVLACFNNASEEPNHPILIQYEPMNSSKLFVPGLESHSGQPPVLGSRSHPRDFKVVFGSRLAADEGEGAWPVRYTNELGSLADLLPTKVVGFRDEDYGTNNDYWASVEDVRGGLGHEDLFMTMPVHASGAPSFF